MKGSAQVMKNAVIFVHDYFSKAFKGAAVKEFCRDNYVKYVPIGDTLSIAIRR